MDHSFILKGDICYSLDKHTLFTMPEGYLICTDGKSAGVFDRIPDRYRSLPLKDFSGCLIIPGLIDLHVHAPQYAFRGMGMDLELLEWLNARTFPEESRYEDLDYAAEHYRPFVSDLVKSPTTRACIFATRHVPATLYLMEQLEASGLITMVGKVNMDRNCPDPLCEKSPEASVRDTEEWLTQSASFQRCRPILTPRFIPSCSDVLMSELSRIRREWDLPIQSHLSENPQEVQWVRELCPDSSCYGDAYLRRGLLGDPDRPGIMAHCVYSGQEEMKLLKQQGVYIAHCPESNANLSSGIAPVRTYLDHDMHIGLGSDIAGGSTLSIFRAMTLAVQCSKLLWRLNDSSLSPLTTEEAFWMGTAGGGSFFGKAGSFEKDFELDTLVLDDRRLGCQGTIRERLERFLYLGENRDIIHKYAAGRLLW